jgi:parvulin-like peptidyl-prolyl isomerase
VAEVAGTPITLKSFNHWMDVAAAVYAQNSGQPAVDPGDPPTFAPCVAAGRKAGLGQTNAQLRTACRQLYTTLSKTTMQFLIQSAWYQAEAASRHIDVTDAQVQQALKRAKQQQFRTDATFNAYLAEQGESVQDIFYRMKVSMIFQRLAAAQGAASVTPAQIQAYYNRHKASFATPETRTINVVLAKDRSDADEARTAVRAGQSWAKVATRYSTDPATKTAGGVLAVKKGQGNAALDDAAFTAPRGNLEGPIKRSGGAGYYVFEVTNITPAQPPPTLAQATRQLRGQLRGLHEAAAANAVDNEVKTRWLGQTNCLPEYTTSYCGNYRGS